MFDIRNDFLQEKCFKRLHLKFNSAHFGEIRSNRKLIFENGLHRKWKPEIGIWIEIPRFLAMYNRSPLGHCPITCQFCKINTLGPTGPARIVRGKLFRSVTVKILQGHQQNFTRLTGTRIFPRVNYRYKYYKYSSKHKSGTFNWLHQSF